MSYNDDKCREECQVNLAYCRAHGCELKAAEKAKPTHYCQRCGTAYFEEGECDWCPGHVQLFAMTAKPAAELP